jgi:hypothetical protein
MRTMDSSIGIEGRERICRDEFLKGWGRGVCRQKGERENGIGEEEMNVEKRWWGKSEGGLRQRSVRRRRR